MIVLAWSLGDWIIVAFGVVLVYDELDGNGAGFFVIMF